MIQKVDHVGVAVANLDETIKVYEELGLKLHGTEIVEDQKVKVAFMPVGDTEVEFLEATDEESTIAKFIEKKGAGVQHIAFRVENVEEALKEMTEKGFRLIDEKPRYGAGGARIAFLHPKSTSGILIELCER